MYAARNSIFKLRSCTLALRVDFLHVTIERIFHAVFRIPGSRDQPSSSVVRMTEGLVCFENYDDIFINPF